jgi:hypothetical protein
VTVSLIVLAERVAVMDVITALFVETDNRNWPAVRITLFRFNLKFLDGNLELEADAAAPEPVRV